MIYVPKFKDILLPLTTQPKVAGFYKIEAVQADGRRRLLADWFPNLITNIGLDQLGSTAVDIFGTCVVGSGNATPAFTDTALQAIVGSTTTQNSQTRTAAASSPYFGTTTIVYNFAMGTATGNLSEVGLGPTSTTLFSRALILDGSGNPTTITVLSSESLFVTYQLNQFIPLADVTGSITIAGTSYSYTLRACNATVSNFWAIQSIDGGGLYTHGSGNSQAVSNGVLGSITSGGITGSLSGPSSQVNNAYSSGSFTMSGSNVYGLASGNFGGGGVTAAQCQFGSANGSRGTYQIGFGSGIPKDGSHILTLSFSTTWARV